jgi:hypothetical protein
VGRGLQCLGAVINNAGAQLAATAQDCLAASCGGLERPKPMSFRASAPESPLAS